MTRSGLVISFGAVLSLVLAACGEPHVVLQAARPDAPLAERQKSYERLRTAGRTQPVVVDSADDAAEHTSLILANGETLHHAEDMLPVVAADSPTAEAARRHAHHRKRASIGYTLGTIGLLFALGSIVVPVWDHLDDDRVTGSPDIWWTGVIGGGAVFVVGTSIAYYNGSRSRDAKIAAFATYDSSLRAHLNLCVAGTRLVDCGEVPAEGGVPAPPPDALASCSSAGAFRLDLRAQGSCAVPARLTIRHDPGQPRRVDLAAGSFDPKAEALDTVAFEPEGCHAELVYRGKGGELRFTFDGTAPGRVAGQGMMSVAGGSSCPVEVKGSFAPR
jgi:hypothetical protein